MPRIPDASQLGYSVGKARAPQFEDRSGSIQARATERLASTVGQAADHLKDKEDRFSFAQAKSSLLQADMAARKSLENDQDWGTYEKRYQESMSKAVEQATKGITNNRDRATFGMEAKLDVERGLGEIRGQARAKEVDWGRSTLASSLDANRNSALMAQDEATRTAFINSTNEHIQGAVEKGYISAQEAERQRQTWGDSFANGYIDTLPYDKQVEALKNFEGNPARFLQPDQRANLLRQAENHLRIERERDEAEKKASMVEARQALNDQMRDIMAASQLGIPTSVPSKAVLVAAFGEHEGTQKHQIAVKASTMSGDVAALQQKPTAEILDTVSSYKPTQTEGAADQAGLYAFMSRAAQNIIEERTEDPAGYLTKHAPNTTSAWMAFQSAGTPEARDKYFAAIEADRERLGLAKGDVLPNSYAKALANEIANPQSAEKLASLMEDQAQRWGKHWPDVHAQVAKDMPDIAAVIGSGVNRSAAVQLASTAKLTDKDLQAMLPPSVKWGDVQADVASEFDKVRRSFPAEGARTWDAINDSAMRLAVSYMQAGDSKGNAIKRAHKALIDDQYAIGEVRSVPFLIPRQFNANEVEEEADRQLTELEVPREMIVAPPGRDPSEFAARANAAIRESAYWVARGDGKGLRLYLDARPTQITRDFEELEAAALVRRTTEQAETQRLREEAMRARSPVAR